MAVRRFQMMIPRPSIAVAAGVLLAATLAQTSPRAQTAVTTLTSPVTGNAANGKKLYYDHACYSCHGFNGETGARPFVPNWPPNLATERSFTPSCAGGPTWRRCSRPRRCPTTPAEALNDAQARDVYAYIRSFKSPPPLPIDKIPGHVADSRGGGETVQALRRI